MRLLKFFWGLPRLEQDIPTEVEMFKLVVVSATCSIAELN